ncbi:hypothetical protein ACRRTK_003892 [Alexandromys fortis]
MEHYCGLITGNKEPVPLKSISVTLSINDFVASVSATLNYENEEKVPLEAFFVFPMDEDSAVYSFEALVDGKKIVAELQEKMQTHSIYEDALSQGYQAYLLEEDDYSRDVFSCNVGNLQPGAKVAVTLRYVQELPLETDGALRYVLPAILNPRYQLSEQSVKSCLNINTPMVPLENLPYTLSMVATIFSQHGIERVQSNCSLSPMQYLADDKTSAQVSLAEGHKFDRDVELLIYYNEVHSPSVAVEMGMQDMKPDSLMGAPSAMVSFYPDVPEKEVTKACGEFVFLMDRSGSMESPMNNQKDSQLRIEAAKETLLLLLKSLPMGCYFNIYGFGSSFEKFFPESVKYTQETMEEAVERVKDLEANLGGTEILKPLRKIYKAPSIPGHPLQLFVFTDGEVSDTFTVINEVLFNSKKHRCFSFGIGEGASTSLIKGIARVTGGTAEFIIGKDRMQTKQEESSGEVCFKYTFKGRSLENRVKFSLQPKTNASFTIHRLAAKSLIQTKDLGFHETSERVKKDVASISIQSGVLSSFTAFLAINKELNQPVQEPVAQREIPRPVMSTSHCSYKVKLYLKLGEPEFESPRKRNAEFFSVTEKSYSSTKKNDDKGFGENLFMQLISLQKGNGSWELDEDLTKILCTNLEDIMTANPVKDGDPSTWATVLAVLWLHANSEDLKCEWELLERKAVAWLHDHAGSSIPMLVQAGSNLLKLPVTPAVFGF